MPSFSRRWWHWPLLALLVLGLLGMSSGFLWNLIRPVLHKNLINSYAAVYKFDPLFVMALVKEESRFQRTARSHRGAIGLMQLMPETALEMARKMGQKVSLAQIEEPEMNIRLGFHYLSLLREEFAGDPVAILAAYNAGPANARAWRKEGPLTLDQIAYPETRAFVKSVLRTHRWLRRFQKVKTFFHG